MGGAMLPDIRAVVAAVFVAAGLLMAAFGALAMFRVAQDSHGTLQAELAEEILPVMLPPIGGPLAEESPTAADRSAETMRKKAGAKKARAARLARERKAAAERRAAQARAQARARASKPKPQQPAT